MKTSTSNESELRTQNSESNLEGNYPHENNSLDEVIKLPDKRDDKSILVPNQSEECNIISDHEVLCKKKQANNIWDVIEASSGSTNNEETGFQFPGNQENLYHQLPNASLPTVSLYYFFSLIIFCVKYI